jgi:hypothetical protein
MSALQAAAPEIFSRSQGNEVDGAISSDVPSQGVDPWTANRANVHSGRPHEQHVMTAIRSIKVVVPSTVSRK